MIHSSQLHSFPSYSKLSLNMYKYVCRDTLGNNDIIVIRKNLT